mmetsp:Transcript_117070/g.342921  ORF Transcript_117070/g.342921 Transcript_117070/m.342921 type:complete len:218 (+) Transcript_117070:137-790(+)
MRSLRRSWQSSRGAERWAFSRLWWSRWVLSGNASKGSASLLNAAGAWEVSGARLRRNATRSLPHCCFIILSLALCPWLNISKGLSSDSLMLPSTRELACVRGFEAGASSEGGADRAEPRGVCAPLSGVSAFVRPYARSMPLLPKVLRRASACLGVRPRGVDPRMGVALWLGRLRPGVRPRELPPYSDMLAAPEARLPPGPRFRAPAGAAGRAEPRGA